MGIFGGFSSYDKAGPGVMKNAPQKKRFFVFWELYFRKFWKMISLSLIYFLFCIPIVTIGPATVALVRILRNYSLEKNAFLFSDFWDTFKQNFLKGFVVGIIDIVLAVSLATSISYYPQLGEQTTWGYILLGITLSITLTVIMMNFFIFLMIAVTDIKLTKIFKNAFALTSVAIGKNFRTLLLVTLTVGAMVLLCMINLTFVFLVPLWMLSFVWFIIVFNSYPIIQKYVINPYYEERGEVNPEYAYLQPTECDQPVFVDKGGSEKPIEGSKRKGKKTIS